MMMLLSSGKPAGNETCSIPMDKNQIPDIMVKRWGEQSLQFPIVP